MSLNDLHQDIWMVILQFFTMEDMLQCSSNSTTNISFQNNDQDNSPKLFGISRRIFSSLIGSEIDHYHMQEDSHEGGGIFYRILNEKLVIRQLELVIDRIVNRPIFVNTAGVNDYDEESNTHNYKPLMEKQRKQTENSRGARVRRMYYTRSRLNVQGNSQSMSKLRRELRGLIMKCQEQFPHIYENYRNRIDNALERSIKICAMVEKPVNNSDNIEYEDNLNRRATKPSIWDEERRRKSIEIPFTSAKNLKNHQWRVQWKFNYSNHLHHELEFHLNYLRVYHNIFYKNYNQKETISIEHYMSLVERTLELVFKFGKDFQEKFFTTRNFFRKKKIRTYHRIEQPIQLEKRTVDFIYQTISCLWKSYGFINNRFSGPKVLDTSIERMFSLIERLMDIYIYFYRNNTAQEYCYGKSIYDLLIRFDKNLFEKYTSNNEINNLPKHLQISFLLSCTKYSTFVPVQLLKSLDIPLKIQVANTPYPLSLGDLVINNHYLWDRIDGNVWIVEWLNFLIDKYGKQEVIDSFEESSLRDVRNGTHYTILKDILGEQFEEKVELLSAKFTKEVIRSIDD